VTLLQRIVILVMMYCYACLSTSAACLPTPPAMFAGGVFSIIHWRTDPTHGFSWRNAAIFVRHHVRPIMGSLSVGPS
jgi:hypothetical protein